MTTRATAFLLLALSLACSGGGGGGPAGPDAPRTLVVSVRRGNDVPVSGAIVELTPAGRTATTDGGGMARFTAVAPGTYTLTTRAGLGNPVTTPVEFRAPFPNVVRVVLPTGTGGLEIAWDGRTVDWGEPAELRATLDGAPAPDGVVWTSTEDFYFGEPVVLGTGPAITTAALRPGTTTVEARLGTGVTARVDVTVRYRVSWNLTQAGRVEYPTGTVGDVWVDENDVAYLSRRGAGGISILQLDGAAREVGRWTSPGLFTQDIDVANGLAVVANEGNAPFSVALVDVTNPVGPRLLGTVATNFRAHTVFLRGSLLSIAASDLGSMRLIDVSNPAAPVVLGDVFAENARPHDSHVRGNVFYGSYLPLAAGQIGELTIADVSNPAAPVVLSRLHYPGAFTHSSWPSDDGRLLYVTDETVNAPIRIYDVTNPAAPALVGRYQPRLGTIPHHFMVRGNLAYLAHYKNGVEVVDLSDPRRPRLAGFFDTHPGVAEDQGQGFPGDEPVFQGVWGVHWTSDGRIVASDMERGLYVFRFTG